MRRLELWLRSKRWRWHVPRIAYGGRRRAKRRGKPWLLILLITLAAIVFLTVWINISIRPIVLQLAKSRVKNLASAAINTAVSDVMAKEAVAYDDLIYLEKDGSGAITAIKTNMIAVNRLKTEVSGEVLAQLSKIKRSELAIPLGSVFKNDLLAGRGPDINVRLVPVGSATATFQNAFSAAGINQTRHQIIMNIDVAMSVLTMGSSVDVRVGSQVVIAETVIVGDVPNAYADLNKDTIWGGGGK